MTMIELAKGNLLTSDVEALVNTVNTEGVMGKGIALQFKQAFPEMFKAYENACRDNQVKLGHVHLYDLGGLVGGPRWIVNFPTKGHWRSKSRLNDIRSGLGDLLATIRRLNIKSIALPPLGCGHGGLNWSDVEPLIRDAFASVPDVHVKLFAPVGAPEANDMPNRTARPNLTEGRASLILLMHRYLQGFLDPFISLLEVHKLMYFLQAAGQPLKLNYEAAQFGPYAVNLRHVLVRLEGHYLQGYGDGQDSPNTSIELLPTATDEAREFLRTHADVAQRLELVAKLIDGFEDSFGLELLSTVHWVITHNPECAESLDLTVEKVRSWNSRKARMFSKNQIFSAWNQLHEHNWTVASETAVH
jgi:O-acetyl-ADP-ribose deacetylase (regulator of RNase III)